MLPSYYIVRLLVEEFMMSKKQNDRMQPIFCCLLIQAIVQRRKWVLRGIMFYTPFLPLLAAAQLHDVRLRVLDPDGTPAANLMCALKAPGAADAAADAAVEAGAAAAGFASLAFVGSTRWIKRIMTLKPISTANTMDMLISMMINGFVVTG